ncbi:MAG: L,D-transpeptidase family protein [Chloroflexi bacterium]|nr:L,D-transpeptidase family protein [Chloroflexota bacterium]
MTQRAAPRLRPAPYLIWILTIIVLAACGTGSDDDSALPTLANMSDLATDWSAQAAATGTTAAPETAAPEAVTSETATPVPSEAPSETPLPPSATASPLPDSPTPSLTPSATARPAEQQAATGIPLTNTALAAVPTHTATVSPPPPTDTPPSTPARPYEIVFYSNRSGSDDVYLLTLDGDVRAVTSGPANEREPVCSPDGQTVVYASDSSGSYQLYLQRFDQSEPIQLTDSEGVNFAPAFSPDGSTIAFVSTRSDGIPTIWLMDADGGNPRQVTTDLGRDTSPAWGPDGRQLLFSSDQSGPWDLYLAVIGEEVEGEFPILPPEFSDGNEVWPHFDATGERIVYTSWGDLEDPQTSDIYLLDFEQPEPVAVRVGEGAAIAWGWGDESHLLASVGDPDDVQIALIDITTGDAVPLTNAGTFNGGARLCTVDPVGLPPEPTRAPSPTPTATEAPTKTLAPTITPARESAISPARHLVQGRMHIVQPGENLLGISYTYGVPLGTLTALNALPNPDRLSIGQTLIVPVTRTGHRQGGYQLPDSDQTGASATRKKIVVRLKQQRVYAYENNRLVRSVIVSTGLPQTPTVEGEFKIYIKREKQTMTGPGYYLPDVPYVMYFYQGYGLHGTYWHDNFGEPMSHGCVNLPTHEARWFYEWAEIGTPVEVLS